jgi:hypothetical protein
MTEIAPYNIKRFEVGDVIVGKRTGNTYDIVDYVMTKWPGHGIYTLVCRETQETRTIADFAIHYKYKASE